MRNTQSKVSVIIPCFNQGQFIDEVVDSVLKQTFRNFEIIIINDGSTDQNTIEILKKFDKPECKIIYTENQGVSNARNSAIHASSGKYILPLDSDDKIGPRYLEESVKILEANKNIGIVYCEAEFFGAKTGRLNLPVFSIENILLRNIIFNCALFRREDYFRTKGFNPNMIYGWEDWDFWLSLIENGAGVYKLPDVHFYYRLTDSNSRNNDVEKNMEKRNCLLKTIYLNHIDLYQKWLGNPIEISEKLNTVLNSKDYKIGRSIVNPVRYFKRFIIKHL